MGRLCFSLILIVFACFAAIALTVCREMEEYMDFVEMLLLMKNES